MSNKKREVKKMHLRKTTIIQLSILGVFVVFLAFFLIYFFGDNVSRQYSSSFLPIDNVYEEITFDEFRELTKEKEDFLLFFSNPTCGVCQTVITPINNMAKKEGIKKIYYINANKLLTGETSSLKTYGIIGQNPILAYFQNGVIYKTNGYNATSCLNVSYDDSGNSICEYYNGSEIVSDGIYEAAEYLFSLYLKK